MGFFIYSSGKLLVFLGFFIGFLFYWYKFFFFVFKDEYLVDLYYFVIKEDIYVNYFIYVSLRLGFSYLSLGVDIRVRGY